MERQARDCCPQWVFTLPHSRGWIRRWRGLREGTAKTKWVQLLSINHWFFFFPHQHCNNPLFNCYLFIDSFFAITISLFFLFFSLKAWEEQLSRRPHHLWTETVDVAIHQFQLFPCYPSSRIEAQCERLKNYWILVYSSFEGKVNETGIYVFKKLIWQPRWTYNNSRYGPVPPRDRATFPTGLICNLPAKQQGAALIYLCTSLLVYNM